jgi:hypothetical protein
MTMVRPRADRASDGHAAAVAALVAAVHDLRRRVTILEGQRRPRPADPERDAKLLATIAAVFGRSVFTIADLHDSPDPELHAMVAGTPGALLSAISNGQPRQPALIGGFAELLALDAGTIRDLQALGVLVLASNAAGGLLIALDQPGLLIAADEIRVDVARHADVLLDDLNPPGGAPTINLWQTNAIGLRCERLLKIGVRPDAVAWTGTS